MSHSLRDDVEYSSATAPETETETADEHRLDRRPGEVVFAGFLVIASLVLVWSAYSISGFESLSSPGTVPMATSAIMLITAVIVLAKTLRMPPNLRETVAAHILPVAVVVVMGLLVGYAVLLEPLGFLPTSALFLVTAVKFLSGRGWLFTLAVSLGSLIVVYLIFRIVFTVLMPPGIVPEGEMLQLLRGLFAGGGA